MYIPMTQPSTTQQKVEWPISVALISLVSLFNGDDVGVQVDKIYHKKGLSEVSGDKVHSLRHGVSVREYLNNITPPSQSR
jgi:hypothetical protein